MNTPQLLTLADTQADLARICEAEPLLQALLELAALQTPETRWHGYEAIKALCYPLIGMGARVEALRSPQAYRAFLRAVDALLPRREEDFSRIDERKQVCSE